MNLATYKKHIENEIATYKHVAIAFLKLFALYLPSALIFGALAGLTGSYLLTEIGAIIAFVASIFLGLAMVEAMFIFAYEIVADEAKYLGIRIKH